MKTDEAVESPAKLLDDLFRKTKAVPCIYWLPLTEEQIAKRETEKKEVEEKRNAERAVRDETLRERREEPRRDWNSGPFYRRVRSLYLF